MTATADTRALLAACRAAPQDAHAALLLADAMFEAGRERDAAHLRCTADPDNDAHRLSLASMWEPTDPERAELVRVQCEISGGDKCDWELSPELHAMGKPGDCERCDLHYRERALLAAHADRWRLGPACEKCGGSGANYDSPKPGWPKGTYSTNCEACRATGDAGGLMRTQLLGHWLAGTETQFRDSGQPYLHRVEHVRGCLRVHCTLAEAWADGKPTDWIRAACRHHPVSEVWLTDMEPYPGTAYSQGWSGWCDRADSVTVGEFAAAAVPRPIFRLIDGEVGDKTGLWRWYNTPELARLALARAVALAVRLDLEERP